MSFWDRIKKWLQRGGPPDKKPVPSQGEATQVRIPPKSSLEASDQPDGADSAGDIGVDTFQVLFSHKNKHTTIMLNSISLSSDMKTLYLIDNGRAIAYDLTVPEGVLIGLLGKQLVVATAISSPALDTSVEAGVKPKLDKQADDHGEKVTFKATKKSQYTLTYNEGHQTLGIIGFDDVILSIDAPDEHECKEHRFEMKANKLVRLLYKTDMLEIFQEEI